VPQDGTFLALASSSLELSAARVTCSRSATCRAFAAHASPSRLPLTGSMAPRPLPKSMLLCLFFALDACAAVWFRSVSSGEHGLSITGHQGQDHGAAGCISKGQKPR